jgi:hypothetical protein
MVGFGTTQHTTRIFRCKKKCSRHESLILQTIAALSIDSDQKRKDHPVLSTIQLIRQQKACQLDNF